MEPGTEKPAAKVGLVLADVATGEGLAEAHRGSDVVIHLAARNHLMRGTKKYPLSEYRRVNVSGTRNVVMTAASAGVKLMIYLSSVKAMGEGADFILDETSHCDPKTPYGISKLESEEVVREEVERTRMNAIIIRLPMVYGPRNKGNFPRMIRWADRGLPFPLVQPDNLRSIIYVENVVAGVLASIKKAPKGVSIYILKDREDYSTRMVYEEICRKLGKSPRYFPVPATLLQIGRLLSENIKKVSGSFRVSSEKSEKELGFSPPIQFEEGIARTVQWYKCSVQSRSV
jgi:nucleoside-diphosphate-sugar epimerase